MTSRTILSKTTIFAAAIAGAALLASAANATMIYLDQSTWAAAAGGTPVNTATDGRSSPVFDIPLADGSTVGLDAPVVIYQVGTDVGDWQTWSGGYASNVYAPYAGPITLALSGLHAFGLEVEPAGYDIFNVTVTLSDGTTQTDPVDGTGGAQFFGWVGDDIESVTISADDTGGFAFGNIYSVKAAGTPEPATLALFGAGLAALGLYRRKPKG